MPLKHLYDEKISAFYVNDKGQLCIPHHDHPQITLPFNTVMESNGNLFFGFIRENISPGKEW